VIKQYFDAQYPARDGRNSIPEDEVVARLAAQIIRGEDDLIWHAEHQGVEVPPPNKSARIEGRMRAGMGQWIRVRGSAEFFAAVAVFAEALRVAGFR